MLPPPLPLLLLLLWAAAAAAIDSRPLLPTKTDVVAASACANGEAWRPCTAMERTAGSGARTSCPCPYLDGVRGGPGPVRRFSLQVQHLELPTLAPHVNKTHVTANGTIPGPPIVVNEGDWLIIDVTNKMMTDPTTIHWHGQLQVMTPFADGVPSMTQCAIQPGMTITYEFRASNAGTFWYHGHMLEQYTEGLFGLFQVLPPAGSPAALPAHDAEASIFITDYYNNPAHDLLTLFYMTPLSEGVEPIPDAIQLNGAFSGQLAIEAPRTGRSLLHFICAAGFSMFSVSIDGVNMQIVALDSTAVVPLTVTQFDINVAQRVDVIVDWSTLALPPGNPAGAGVYLRVTAMTEMYALYPLDGYVPPYEQLMLTVPPGPLVPNVTAAFQFSPLAAGVVPPAYAADGTHGAAPAAPPLPTYPASSPYAGLDAALIDTNVFDAVPVIPLAMPTGTHQLYLEILFFLHPVTQVNIGHFNSISHVHNMVGGMMPTLFDKTVYGTPRGTASANNPSTYTHSAAKPFGYADTGLPLPPLPIAYTDEAHYFLPPGAVVQILINNTDGGEHPIHIHGHTVWIIATSDRPDAEAERMSANNLVRRDVVSVPGGGWLKLAIIAEKYVLPHRPPPPPTARPNSPQPYA